MEREERENLIRETEQRVRAEIARKMQADRMSPQLIRKYTGIDPEASAAGKEEYDLAAKQVACEMLLHGLPLDTIAAATGVPYSVLRELKSQMPD